MSRDKSPQEEVVGPYFLSTSKQCLNNWKSEYDNPMEPGEFFDSAYIVCVRVCVQVCGSVHASKMHTGIVFRRHF